METKKKAHLKLEQNSKLYFVMGMTIVLGLTYIALEWKSFNYNISKELRELNKPETIDEVIPPLAFNTPTPPPPPTPPAVTPTVFEIATDDPGIIDTPIASTETTQETKVLKTSDIIFEEIEEEVTIILDLIDEAPIFPGCEKADNKRACFQKMMTKHVRKNFRYPDLAIDLNLKGRVSTQFIIGKDGSIEDIKMRGPHQVLEKEASRILSKLPQMTPGKHKGKNAKVVFSLPINFQMQ